MALGLSNILQMLSAGGQATQGQALPGIEKLISGNTFQSALPERETAVVPEIAPPPAQMMQQPEASRPRRSLVDIIGRIADGIAVVGGAPAQYQPTLDAMQGREQAQEDRMRQIDLDALRKQQLEQQVKAGATDLQGDERARLGQALGAVAGNPDAAALWPQIAEQAGLSPERAAQVGEILTKNPQAAGVFAQSLGWAPEKQGSQAKELQIYGLLRQENPEAANAYLQSLSNPDSMTPYQSAMLAKAMQQFEFDQFKYANPQPTEAMRNAAAGITTGKDASAGGGSDDVNAILTDFNIKLSGKDDPVADLIRGSTSGYVENIASMIPGALGQSTPGQENIGRLETIDNALVLALAGGKLGAGVSNADRDFFKEMSGKISDPNIPSNRRVAAWEQIKARLRGIQRRAAQPAARPAARPAAAKPRYQPSPNRKPVPTAGNAAAIAEARRRGLIK